MRRLLTIQAAAALAIASAAGAQPHRGSPTDRAPPPEFHGGDVRGPNPEARARWRGGEWRHTWHDGRFGWWWFVGDDWFWFDEPIYPYPQYVPPPVVEAAPYLSPPPLPPPPHYWYRCAAPAGFYPYVTNCPGGWRAVPATPPPSYAQP